MTRPPPCRLEGVSSYFYCPCMYSRCTTAWRGGTCDPRCGHGGGVVAGNGAKLRLALSAAAPVGLGGDPRGCEGASGALSSGVCCGELDGAAAGCAQ